MDALPVAPAPLRERLAFARGLSGLNPTRLSVLAELARGHVGLIESARIESPDVDTARALARVLGLSLVWLLEGEGEVPTEEGVRSAVEEAKKAEAARKAAESPPLAAAG